MVTPAPTLMDFLGIIAATPDSPSVDLGRWTHLITTHPNLEAVAPEVGLIPFTNQPLAYRPHPGTAWVVVTGRKVGMMSWAEDGANQISVWGEAASVAEVAAHVAAQIGGTFSR